MRISTANSSAGCSRPTPPRKRPWATPRPEDQREARRLRLQAPPWEAPLQIVPGVPTLVLTGGWEPLYEEIAGYLRETGALHRTAAGGHRPQDSAEGNRVIRGFIADVGRQQHAHAS